MVNIFKKKKIDTRKKCKNCASYDKASAKYGICLEKKSNKFIKFVFDTSKNAIIMVPRNGTCKYFKSKIKK